MTRIFSRTELFSLIKQLPVFASLGWWDRRYVAEYSKIVEYRKGDIIYKQDDSPNSFFCIISGRVQIFTHDSKGEEITIEYAHRGKYFGIISLLTGDVHSVSTRVVNDALILQINKPDFDSILKRIPNLAIHFSQSLSRRLKRKDLHAKTIFESTILSVYSPSSGLGCSWYLINLGLSLKKETQKKVILVNIGYTGTTLFNFLDIGGKPLKIERDRPHFDEKIIKDYIYSHRLGIDVFTLLLDTQALINKEQISAVLSFFTNEYHYILVDLPHEMNEATLQAITQSDRIHLLFDSSRETLKRIKSLLDKLKESIQEISEKIKLIIIETQTQTGSGSIVKLLNHPVYATLQSDGFLKQIRNEKTLYQPSVIAQPDIIYSRTIRRIAREIGEVLVGLALSSGAAFGLAHIGVIKALEEEEIPIDIVIGSSMGALISVFWASGKSGKQMEDIAMQFHNPWAVFNLLDFTVPFSGFLSGRGARRFLYKHLGKKTFHDIRFPVKVIACDIINKESIIIDHGKLVDAVRASISIPGIFKPVKLNNRLLVDGSILSPVPIETLSELGINKVIAVNVIPSPEEVVKARQELHLKETLRIKKLKKRNPLAWLLNILKIKIRYLFFPNIMDIIMNSMHAMEYTLAEISCNQADIVIRPTSPETNWFEFYNSAHLIKKGEEETRKAIPKIKELLSE